MRIRWRGSEIAPTLTVIFLALKISHTVEWSWWIVFLPMFINIALSLVAIIVTFIAFRNRG